MAYTDFTPENVGEKLGVNWLRQELFPELQPVEPPNWLTTALARGRLQAVVSEKSRSEFLIAPILLGAQQLSQNSVSIFSGQRLTADPNRGLDGECDFILAAAPAVPVLTAPVLIVVEAKRQDMEAGVGQCVAAMVAARIFNERTGDTGRPVFGCVTTGEAWQFLRLDGSTVTFDEGRFYLDNVGAILAALVAAVEQAQPLAV